MTPAPAPELAAFLLRQGLAKPGEPALWTPLTGGVSSDLWRVDLPGRAVCVKRAMPRLRVSADWRAPVSRNAYEWAWIRFAACHCPDNVPVPLARDADAGFFVMAFLPPDQYPVWKAQLMRGEVRSATAAAVGEVLGQLHAASADDGALARAFASDENFAALRLEPYLLATAAAHPELSSVLREVANRTARVHRALVHGDVSPKNILVGPAGPVFLDAECAWYGDPAFDLAFCLNHLLLKCLVQPTCSDALLTSATALSDAYLARVIWESRGDLEARSATLLPALLLARIDGKSPVEYLTDEPRREVVRATAANLLRARPERLAELLDVWRAAVSDWTGQLRV
jgi:aminoglycoside phosphotransferase (APT) family kinase protein